MPHSEEEARKAIEEVMAEFEIKRTLDVVYYREDYQDYLLLLDKRFHAEIRGKLIEDYYKFSKDADIKRNIRFLLEHPVEYEDWELEDMGVPVDNDDKPAVDDKDKYDFI